MKLATVLWSLMVVGSAQAALADECADRFVALFLQPDQGIPTKTLATTAFKGAPAMTNKFYYLSREHSMTVPISPPQPRTMTHGAVFYQSSDDGGTWQKVRDLDPLPSVEEAKALKRKDADSVRNAECDEVELEGAAHDRVAADITITQGIVTENRYTYWVRQSDGFIVKATYDTKAANFELVITQEIEPAPGLELPVPE